MTPQIVTVLAILVAAVVLFVTEWIRMDVVALLVLVALAIAGLVTPAEALSGFSNPAVVTVWAVFILSGGLGPLAVMAGLYLLATLATQVMPNPAVAVLLAPIAISTAANLNVSPYALMMTVALAASASFLSPVAHPANVLIMGPGGYRFSDYIKVGAPLTLVVLVVTLVVLPIFWPL